MKEEISILIVDDNVNYVSRMRRLLEEMEKIKEIRVADGYDKAIELLSERSPDFVLLDINLPGKNGIEILRLIKKNSWNCEVIMITNHADEYYRQQCFDLGARHFLDKSSDFGMVTEIIGQHSY
jgi:DNA-binding NarL/FixJ family response regulator